MDIRIAAFALSALMIAGTALSPAFAQENDILGIEVSTDKNEAYMVGESIMVSGNVNAVTGDNVSIVITAPTGNIVAVDQLTVDDDGMFAATFNPNPAWVGGTYTIAAQYGDIRATSITFEFVAAEPEPEQPPMFSFSVDDNNFDMVYNTLEGEASITSVETNQDDFSVVIGIDAPADDEIEIALPRDLIDSLDADGGDITFIVLVDGEETDHFETNTDMTRTLTIPVTAGSQMIEIFGTVVIPEFGTIALLVLAAAIVSIIAVSSRSRLSVLPKY